MSQTYFVFSHPGVNILNDVLLVLQVVNKPLQLAEVSAVVDRLEVELAELSVCWEIFLVGEVPAGDCNITRSVLDCVQL